MRDGKYVPLTEQGDKLFASPLDGWAYLAGQVGAFQIQAQPIQPGEFIYFIVDALADGTSTPHHGNATRFDVTLAVRDAKRPPPPSFEKDVLPVLAEKCHDCHGASVQEAKLDLRTLSALLQGGESGPAIVPGDPGGSLLVDLVAQGQMPPEGSEKLTAAELATLRRWVKARTPAEEQIVALPPRSQVSTEDRQFWAFQPPRTSGIPRAQRADRVRNADRCVFTLQAGSQEPDVFSGSRSGHVDNRLFDGDLSTALWDVGPAPTSRVHRRGNVQAPGVLVQAGFPEILQPSGSVLAATAADASGESSGRRLALARWLTRPDHPLTARVVVNRVWQHHFGRGIAETAGNFGRSGSLPTHPELLDWLTVDFVEHGWSLKRLHRQVLLSSAYRQCSRRPHIDT